VGISKTCWFYPSKLNILILRRLYGEKTVRKAERAWFFSEGEESEALNRIAFGSLGQKQRVLEPYSLNLPPMVASSIPKYFLMIYKTCFTHTKWKRTFLLPKPTSDFSHKKKGWA